MSTSLKILLTFFIGISSISQIKPQCVTIDRTQIGKFQKEFNKGEFEFTTDLLLAVSKASPYENVFVSPFSMYNALLLAYFGSQKATEKVFKKALHLTWADSKADVMRAYRFQKLARTKSHRGNETDFSSVDRLFFSSNVELNTCLKDYFVDELESMDFQQQAEKSRVQINNWVESVTKNMIKGLLVPGSVTSQTNVVLANAAYFKGQWETKFDAAKTKEELFYPIVGSAHNVPMMTLTGQFKFTNSQELGCRILDIPYTLSNETQTSMMIFLPNNFDLDYILYRLTPELLAAAIQEDEEREVELKLPKFTVEKSVELRPLLQKLNLEDMFSANADFGGFSDKVNVGFDEGIHKAKIEVDENGSTAAAATAVFGFRSGFALEKETFICNYPFFYMIYDHKESVVLFAGIYRGKE